MAGDEPHPKDLDDARRARVDAERERATAEREDERGDVEDAGVVPADTDQERRGVMPPPSGTGTD